MSSKDKGAYRLSDSGRLLIRGEDEPLLEAVDADRALMQRIADLLNYGAPAAPREGVASPMDRYHQQLAEDMASLAHPHPARPGAEDDRITPYETGGNVEDRIDEIVLTGADVHIEMLDERHACMWLGERMFAAYVDKGELVIALREGDG